MIQGILICYCGKNKSREIAGVEDIDVSMKILEMNHLKKSQIQCILVFKKT